MLSLQSIILIKFNDTFVIGIMHPDNLNLIFIKVLIKYTILYTIF
jgi:hypothetical protein